MKTVKAKLAGMRKPQDFVVYKPNMDDPTKPVNVIVQSDRAIGQFDPATRKGLLNYKGSHSKYFHHLNKMFGAEEFEFPEEFVREVMDCIPQRGDKIGPGVYMG